MTLIQLEYLVALDTYRHFAIAAEKCFVTQPTLSMQIQKLEEELGVKIFDRTKQPVIPTEIGALIIGQARKVLQEAKAIRYLISEQLETIQGELRIGIIPTLAPYILPSLFKHMRAAFPKIILTVKEVITEELIHELKSNRLDCGIVVTPLKENAINEEVLFYEELFVYVSKNNALYDKKYVLPNEIDPTQLWLLEEGHCFRSQVLNLCELQKLGSLPFKYETGNIETLKRMVDTTDGITILPELAILEFTPNQMQYVKKIKAPAPARQVSLVMHRNHMKTRLLHCLKEEILRLIPERMRTLNNKKIVEIHYAPNKR
ncbi:MAG: LysR substrate-binding domain-containing protein [Chitinophagales bacterium]